MSDRVTNSTLLFLGHTVPRALGLCPSGDVRTDPQISTIVSNVNSNNI